MAEALKLKAALTGAAHTVVFTLLARYLDAIGLTKSQVGDILAADAWGKVLVGLPAALVLARRPARGIFVTAAVVGGLAYLALPFVRDFRALLALNLGAGFAFTLHYVAIAPFLFRNAEPSERAKVFGLNGARVYGIDADEVKLRAGADRVGQQKLAYAENPNPHFQTFGPRNRREFLNFRAMGG